MSDPAIAAALGDAETALHAAEAANSAAPASDTDAIVDAWFNASIANSPVSRSVDAINHLTQVAIPALKSALKKG